MAEAFWTDSPAWNTVVLGDVTLPGLCVVEFEIGEDIEVTKSKGKNGARCKDQGRDPCQIDVEVTLGTRQHWEDWQKAFPKLNPRRANAIKEPKEIIYPDLNVAGITKVIVHKIKAGAATAGGGKRYTIRLLEWFPELVEKSAKTNKAKPAVANKPAWQQTPEQLTMTPTGVDALDRMFLS